MRQKMIKAIIFDMDGVITDSLQIHVGIWKRLGREYGFSVTNDSVEKFNGMDTLNTAKHFVSRFSLDADPVEIAERKKRLVNDSLRNGAPLFSGVKETLERLKSEGYLLGLGTSSTKESAILTLGDNLPALGFDAMVTDSDVMNAKPAPDIFLKCSELLHTRPDGCIAVDDAKNGITAAKNAGMMAVGITNSSPAPVLSDADAIIDNISEIGADLIRKLEEKQEHGA